MFNVQYLDKPGGRELNLPGAQTGIFSKVWLPVPGCVAALNWAPCILNGRVTPGYDSFDLLPCPSSSCSCAVLLGLSNRHDGTGS